MQRDLNALTERTFDLLVIGGGIFGACAANDAAQRGLNVALIERGDFCSATSAHSYKLLHGGLRYLQHADLIRVRESACARRSFIRVAPHLAHPLPIVVPTYGMGMKSKPALRAAMTIYDTVTFDRNNGVADPARHVPRGHTLNRDQVLARYPGLSPQGLTGAGVFCDGQMFNPPRLVLAFVETAVKHGAVAANYVEAVNLIREGDRIGGIEARDTLAGHDLTIKAKVVLNAAGPYAEGLLARALGKSIDPPVYWSRDAFLVVDRQLVAPPHALALQAQSHDPEAMLSRGARHLFLVPWQNHATLVGVWHKVYKGHPDQFTVTDAEIEKFLDEINGAYDGLKLSGDDVSMWNAGLIPFGENEQEEGDLKFAHRSRLVDHAKERQLDGLITLIGVRYTTSPLEAVKAVNIAFRKLGCSAPDGVDSRSTPLVGGDITDFAALARTLARFGEAIASHLAHNHGTRADDVVKLADEHSELAAVFPDGRTLHAEVVHAVRDEMAQTVHDVVLRRTDLGTAAYPGRSVIETCADLMARELGWDQTTRNQQVEQCIEKFPANIRKRVA
ncbi:MAG: glycerol-3-phosphate dehydrogenase/oxidase [Phycisphaeraceae bacterium]|nr:glycerol-3-phosphate dehydrogenase/oxidase [Phycisphaeraceae bacterium]